MNNIIKLNDINNNDKLILSETEIRNIFKKNQFHSGKIDIFIRNKFYLLQYPYTIKGDYNNLIIDMKFIIHGNPEYDNFGYLTKVRSINATTYYTYDNKHNLIKQSTTYDNSVKTTFIKFEYDDNNNLIKQIVFSQTENIEIYSFEYDKSNNKIKEICPGGNFWQEYEYDDNNNMIKEIVHEAGKQIKIFLYEYDKLGNNIKKIFEDGSMDKYEYDDHNNIILKDTCLGIEKIKHYYDKNNVLIKAATDHRLNDKYYTFFEVF